MAVLYARYLPSIWRYVYSRLGGDDATCRDIVSETFLAAVQTVARLDVSTNIAAWLTGVARNKLADYWRRSGREDAGQQDDTPGRETDPADAIHVSETRQTVGRVMDRLDDQERIALEWKYIDGLTVREIAQRLGRSDKAVEAILSRARAEFRLQYQRIAHPIRSDRTDRSISQGETYDDS